MSKTRSKNRRDRGEPAFEPKRWFLVDESKLPPADRTADGIGLLDLSTLKVVRNYPSGQDPEAFDLSPDGRTLYVSNEDAAQMSVVDLTSGSITSRAAVGEEPEGVTVRP